MKIFFHKYPYFGIALIYSILVLPFLGSVHLFDWDEINFAEAARAVLITGDWWNVQIEFWPFWEKPPLFIWMQALSMQIFGINEFAARFPNYVIGLITLCVLFRFLKKQFNTSLGLWAVLLYMGAITPQFYFHTGIIDPTFNLFIFLSILALSQAISQQKLSIFFLSGLWLGLSVLTKGPASILLVGLTGLVYQIRYQHHFYGVKGLLSLIVGLLLFPSIWLFFQSQYAGFWFVREFLWYQVDLFLHPVASHGQPFYYHPMVLLVGCFPLLIIALRGLFFKMQTDEPVIIKISRILFWVVLVVFSLVTTKIVHYSSMCYLPAAVLGAYSITHQPYFNRLQKMFIGFIGILWTLVLVSLISLMRLPSWKNWVQNIIKDDFVLSQMAIETHWPWYLYLLPLLIFIASLLLILAKKTNGIRTGSSLGLYVVVIALMALWIVPRVEQHTQHLWINHLKTYQNKNFVHLTVGFKSYAHLFYTQHNKVPSAQKASKEILKRMKKSAHTEMNDEERSTFYVAYRDYLIHETQEPITVSMKIPQGNKDYFEGKLNKVFEGNGYVIWERK